MAHDRVSRRKVPLTHEFLTLMLTVRRPRDPRRYRRWSSSALVKAACGEITVLDRDGLEASTGAPYVLSIRYLASLHDTAMKYLRFFLKNS